MDGGGGWAYARPPAKVASSHVTPRWVECISHRVLFSLFGLGSAPEGPLFGKRRNRLKCNPKRHTSRLHPQMHGLLQPLSIRSSLWVPCRALARYRKIGQVRFVTRRKSRTMRATRKIVRELTERRCPKEQRAREHRAMVMNLESFGVDDAGYDETETDPPSSINPQ